MPRCGVVAIVVGVVLDEHSDEYTAGEKSSAPRSTFNVDALNGLAYKATDNAKIHALRHHNNNRPYDKRKARPDRQEYGARNKNDNTKTCRACLSAGHCVTSGDICYPLAKATLCQSFINNNENGDLIKRNIRDYRKERKERQYKSKTASKMRGAIHKMYAEGTSEKDLTPIIRLTQAMEESDDDDDYYSDDSASDYE